LSQCAIIADADKFICSTLRQAEARLCGEKWLDGRFGLPGLLERLEANR
jgi:hypothetical protein